VNVGARDVVKKVT